MLSVIRIVNTKLTEILKYNIDEDCDGVALVIDNDKDGYNSDVDCNDNDELGKSTESDLRS